MKSTVGKLEMTKKEPAAVKTLKSALKISRKERKLHEEYEIEMLLVEMFNYKVIVSLILNLFIHPVN